MSDNSDEATFNANENVAIAMALVIGAGGATGLGAAAVFVPSIVKLASRRVLAGSLGFSAGVMTYVSFIEIFQKSQLAFLDADHGDGNAYTYATLCFFGGVLLMMMLNIMVASLLGGHTHRSAQQSAAKETDKKRASDDDDSDDHQHQPAPTTGGAACCSKDPVGQLEKLHTMASELEGSQNQEADVNLNEDIEDDFVDNIPLGDNASDLSDDNEGANAEDKKTTEENRRLVTMGMNTAVAIGLHNFPEGLATFVAALDDPKVGSVLALAIAIHNIPEGLCVALPIFYATGKRTNAFLWALLSGASEIVAALLGWAILASAFSQNTYGILFGFVAGMMVMISVRELLPTAHFYDPQDTVVTYSFICGMIVMALSLVMFQL